MNALLVGSVEMKMDTFAGREPPRVEIVASDQTTLPVLRLLGLTRGEVTRLMVECEALLKMMREQAA